MAWSSRNFLMFVICSHEEIDVSHPEFFSAAKHNGYVPPNKEVFTMKKSVWLWLWHKSLLHLLQWISNVHWPVHRCSKLLRNVKIGNKHLALIRIFLLNGCAYHILLSFMSFQFYAINKVSSTLISWWHRTVGSLDLPWLRGGVLVAYWKSV